MPFFVSALLSLAVAAGASSAGAEVWSPAPGTSWQWQLQGRLDTSVDADVYDVDAFDTKKGAVADLHTHGRRVICYVTSARGSAGGPTRHDFRGACSEGSWTDGPASAGSTSAGWAP